MMDAEHLLTHFDRIADAPDAIPRLRRFILDLAVRGKLVEQDPNDEPAAELLKRTEQTRDARHKRKLALIKIDPSETDFDLPDNWDLAPLGALGGWAIGAGFPKSEQGRMEGPYFFLKVSDMNLPGNEKVIATAQNRIDNEVAARIRAKVHSIRTIIFPKIGGAIATNKRRILGRPSAIDNNCLGITITNEIDLDWAYLLLTSLDFTRYQAGTAVPALQQSVLERIPVGIPPLAEQHRIVAKVDELMALCDRLETAQKERETTRDRLAAASLARLNAPDPDPAVFQNHAAFALDNLVPLTTRPDQIKALRQTILSLAVQGKLVEQDPNEEPAAELLKRIAVEKKRLVEAGEIRKPKLLPSTDESPFDIPPSWQWKALREIVHFENGDRSKNYPSGSDIKTAGVPFFSTKNISDHAVKFDQLDFITEEKFKSLRSGKLKDLDILITLRGSVGKLGLFQATEQFATGFINAQLLIIRNFERNLVRFCLTFMKSQTFLDQILDRSSGSTTPQLSASQLAEVLIPLPPLAEQHCIVAKVDELMTLCDRLEASLATGDETRGRLVEAVLHETLETDGEGAA